MVKRKTSGERKTSCKKDKMIGEEAVTFREQSSLEYLLNEDNIAQAILQCFEENDAEGLMEVIDIYLKALNKAKSLKKGETSEKNGIKAIIKAMRMTDSVEPKLA